MKFDELNPWIESGFVQIVKNWWQGDRQIRGDKKLRYFEMMRMKLLAEIECKRIAISLGIDIFVSLDLDEYLVPMNQSNTLIDELDEWFNATTRGVALLEKIQFPAVPHILEPINLLTIEAYQTKYPIEGKMNYYMTVSRKVAIKLFGAPEMNDSTTQMLIHCADFHGCCSHTKHNKAICEPLLKTEYYKVCVLLVLRERRVSTHHS